MKPVQHTIRLPVALDTALKALAERHDISVYQMLQRSVKTGVATLANPPQSDSSAHDIFGEVASISLAIVGIERMLDRALFTSCAAYCYARSAAQGARKTDEAVTAEITVAYDRQRRLSQGAGS
jgi:hypothetical protein